MTSLPICWFATFDFQHEKAPEKPSAGDTKKYLMRHPLLYKIGIDSSCFSESIFAQWVAYGLWHAFVVYLTTMIVLA